MTTEPVQTLANRAPGQLAEVQAASINPMGLMQMLVQGNTKIDPAALPGMLKELVTLQHMVEDRDARKEFAAAVSAFHAEVPFIPKNRKIKGLGKDEGAKFDISYADLQQIVRICRPMAAKHGLSFTWDSVDGAGRVTATCILKHVNGHKETASHTALDGGGSMSAAQKHTGAWTTARRLSLVSVLGLVDTEDEPEPQDVAGMKPITKDQADTIKSYLSEVGMDAARLLRAFPGTAKIEDLRVVQYATAIQMLEGKAKAMKGGAA